MADITIVGPVAFADRFQLTNERIDGVLYPDGLVKGDGTVDPVAAMHEADFGGPVPHIDLDFVNALYWNAPKNPPNALTCTRASVGYIDTAAGVWSQVAANTIRRSDKGTLVEEARTNQVRNNSMQGVAAGSPGTAPTNWVLSVPTGLTRTISTGTTNGIEWVEFNWAGTASSTAQIVVRPEPASTYPAAASGETWTTSAWLSNGASSGISALTIGTQGLDGSNAQTEITTVSFLNAAWDRVPATRTLNSASTTKVGLQITSSTINNGAAGIDVTIRIGWPQIEEGEHASSPIRTTSAAVTRNADVVRVNLPPTFGAAYTLAAKGTPLTPLTFSERQFLVSVSDGTASNRFALYRNLTNGNPRFDVNNTGTDVGGSAWAQSASGKLAAAYAAGSQAASFDGGTVTTDNEAGVPAGLTIVSIGAAGNGQSQWNGYIERVIVWANNRLGNQFVKGIAGTLPVASGYVSALDYGTTTNDDAGAGRVGEYASSTVLVGSAVSLTSGATANITSISLTAGDWDLWGVVAFNPAGTTTTTRQTAAIHTTSATLPTSPNGGAYADDRASLGAGLGNTLPVGAMRLSLSATTTVYLVAQATFATSTMTAYGFIGARRVR